MYDKIITSRHILIPVHGIRGETRRYASIWAITVSYRPDKKSKLKIINKVS